MPEQACDGQSDGCRSSSQVSGLKHVVDAWTQPKILFSRRRRGHRRPGEPCGALAKGKSAITMISRPEGPQRVHGAGSSERVAAKTPCLGLGTPRLEKIPTVVSGKAVETFRATGQWMKMSV